MLDLRTESGLRTHKCVNAYAHTQAGADWLPWGSAAQRFTCLVCCSSFSEWNHEAPT